MLTVLSIVSGKYDGRRLLGMVLGCSLFVTAAHAVHAGANVWTSNGPGLPEQAPVVCIGDCSGDDQVRTDEPLVLMNIALGNATGMPCGLGVPSGGAVNVSLILQAINNALTTCGSADRCSALNGRVIGEAAITAAVVVPDSEAYPEYCQVIGTIAPRLNFEVRLPTIWSGRAVFLGGSGLNGSIPAPEGLMFNPSIATAGYVTIGSDSGHQGSLLDGSWALDDPEAVQNFAYLATHRVLGAARAIVAARYGRGPQRTYFIGASQGGREGLIAAQRWPDDFDGIVSLEPVYDLTALVLAENRVAQHVFATPGGRLSAPKVATLSRAVLAACDALDGIADGIISNLSGCHFDPATLRCDGADSVQCLTDPQIDTVNAVHGELMLDFALANDVRSYPGWPVGHEDIAPAALGGWPFWIVGATTSRSSSQGFVLSDQMLRFLITHDAQLDTLHFSAAGHEPELLAFSTLADATDPDLSAFAARGGKLILWHGLADYGVSPRSTLRYYERVVSTLGSQGAADEFLRFYTSPGVDHLNVAPGAGTIDFLGALTAWVEAGAAPGDLVAVKLAPESAAPLLSRPLCRYPNYPHYNGSGDPNDAASFGCVAP